MNSALDIHQTAAVLAEEPRVRVRAGAGSGKTRVLQHRVEYLLSCGVPAERICATTFSKRAAEELVSRLGPVADAAQVSTLHSLGYAILKLELPGRDVAGDYRRYIRRALNETKTRISLRDAVKEISRAKMTGCPMLGEIGPDMLEAGRRYQELLDTHPLPGGRRGRSLWDFDDLLVAAELTLREDAEARARWQRWTHILVDEVQDNSSMQWALIRHLLRLDTNLFIVGDVSQTLYGFRGAAPRLMLEEADRVFGTFTDYQLPINYRSVAPVVSLANAVMEGRHGALMLEPDRTAGSSVDVVKMDLAETRLDEARAIARRLHIEAATGRDWRDMAILGRTNAQSEPLEAACLEAQIPCVVVGGQGFYARHDVKDILAYLKLSVRWDADALERVYNKPNRFLGAAFEREVEKQGGWPAVASGRKLTFAKPFMSTGLQQVRMAVAQLQRERAGGAGPGKLVELILGRLGYREWLCSEAADSDPDDSAAETLDAIQAAANRWDRVEPFLEFAALCQRRMRADSVGRVQISTVHKAKGLEWPVVVVAGISSGVLPHKKGEAEEERRILYVAVTRARDRLYLSAHGDPSIYWDEVLNEFGFGARVERPIEDVPVLEAVAF